jgi:hypothetical protein
MGAVSEMGKREEGKEKKMEGDGSRGKVGKRKNTKIMINRFLDFVHYPVFQKLDLFPFTMETERHDHFPFLDTGDPMALWAIKCTISLPIRISI